MTSTSALLFYMEICSVNEIAALYDSRNNPRNSTVEHRLWTLLLSPPLNCCQMQAIFKNYLPNNNYFNKPSILVPILMDNFYFRELCAALLFFFYLQSDSSLSRCLKAFDAVYFCKILCYLFVATKTLNLFIVFFYIAVNTCNLAFHVTV